VADAGCALPRGHQVLPTGNPGLALRGDRRLDRQKPSRMCDARIQRLAGVVRRALGRSHVDTRAGADQAQVAPGSPDPWRRRRTPTSPGPAKDRMVYGAVSGWSTVASCGSWCVEADRPSTVLALGVAHARRLASVLQDSRNFTAVGPTFAREAPTAVKLVLRSGGPRPVAWSWCCTQTSVAVPGVPESGVGAVVGDQVKVGAEFGDEAGVHHRHPVGVVGGLEAVGDRDHGTSVEHRG
jgi:hypothetical protein